MKKTLAVLVVLISLAVMASPVFAGDVLDGFKLNAIDGKTYDAESVKGKPVVISVMAQWCTSCLVDAQNLQKAYLEYKDKGVLFFGVFIKSNEEGIKGFVDTTHMTFPAGLDSGIAAKLGVFTVPTNYFIGSDGTVVKKSLGAVDYEKVKSDVEAILQ